MAIIAARADYAYLAKMLCALPSDVRVRMTIECIARENELMARDRPGDGRRFTNLTTGTEWFISEESLRRMGVLTVEFDPFIVTTIGA